jgi:hypothetical protein
MDFNDFLRNTKTAAEQDKCAVKALLAGHKRGSDSRDPLVATDSTADTSAKRSRRSGTVEGLNLQAAQDALAQERDSTFAHAKKQRVQADLLSEQAAARMAHQVIDYVLQMELGGRHNASKGGVPPYVPSTEQLAAERAMWTPAAGYSIHHIVPATADPTTASTSSADTLKTLVSVTEKERVPEGVRLLRSSLQMCDLTRDLVGGVRSGMAPHLRAHVLAVLERGLRGEAWVRDDATATSFLSTFGKPTAPEKAPSSVLLFRDTISAEAAEHRTSTSEEYSGGAAAAAMAPSAANTAGAGASSFSLNAFLNGNDSSSASSDDDDEGHEG